jgi:REP-associated tyrosine transposase
MAHLPSFRPQSIVFLTAVTFERRPLLSQPSSHKILRVIWERSAERNGWYVGDYVLMPDHVHFFAQATTGSDRMCDWVRMWKSVSSRQITKVLNVRVPVWQEDYFDRYLRSAESYGQKWQYVRNNPVRAGLVRCPEDWPYQGRIWSLNT